MKKFFLFAIGTVLLYTAYSFFKYYISEGFDYQDRPWAYARDKATPLLVGEWEGTFVDPDGVNKTIQLEIFLPLSNSDRMGRAFTERRHRISTSKTAFDGVVTVGSKLGKEEYEIDGAVSQDDDHRFHFKFYQAENAKRVSPNFNLNEAQKGKWGRNGLDFEAKFSFHKADGSSLWTSSDPRFSKNVIISLKRRWD